jgi:hypothetical protein
MVPLIEDTLNEDTFALLPISCPLYDIDDVNRRGA